MFNYPKARTYVIGGGTGAVVSGRLSTHDRQLWNDAGLYRAVWCGALYLLSKSTDEQKVYLDWVKSNGFGGVRVFCGDLGQVGQTIESALQALPAVLEYAQQIGLYVEATALTGTYKGYDAQAHVDNIAAVCNSYSNTIMEMANEPYHATQSEQVHDPNYLKILADRVPSEIITALGASSDDESTEFAGGDFVTIHMDRGRDPWNMVRRVRELENVSSSTKKFVMNNEAIKFGSQLNDPAICFTMSVLNRGFEVGGILHADFALAATIPDSSQQRFADSWIRGATCIATKDVFTFYNAVWQGSPVAGYDESKLVRAYSFLAPSQNVLVEVGVIDDGGIQFKDGWSRGDLIAEEQANDGRKCRVFNLV